MMMMMNVMTNAKCLLLLGEESGVLSDKVSAEARLEKDVEDEDEDEDEDVGSDDDQVDVTKTTVTRMTILASTVTTVSGLTPTVPVCWLAHWIPFPVVTVGCHTRETISSPRTGNLLYDQQPSILV